MTLLIEETIPQTEQASWRFVPPATQTPCGSRGARPCSVRSRARTWSQAAPATRVAVPGPPASPFSRNRILISPGHGRSKRLTFVPPRGRGGLEVTQEYLVERAAPGLL